MAEMNSLIIILATLLLSAFFSGMEIAFLTSNKLKIELDRNSGLLSGRILSQFVRNPSNIIATLLVGNNIALVIYGMAMTYRLEPVFGRILPDALNHPFTLFIIQTIVSTLLILVLAEFLPKALFRINPNTTIRFFSVPLYFFYLIFYPVVHLFGKTSEFILRKIFKIRIKDDHNEFTPIDLDNFLKEIDDNQLKQSEAKQEIQMFQNAMDFHLIKLRECMVPRNEIVAISENEKVEKLAELMASTGFSRIPVYSDSIDNIIGYTHVFDLYKRPQSIQSIIKPIIIAPETMTADKILTTFIQQHKSIALVVDEFGGTSGIVTMEDVIEEIFGEINDEFDEVSTIEKKLNEDEFLFSARLEIDYLNQKYNLELPVSDDYETLGGLIVYHHESIPEKNEVIHIDKYQFTIDVATSNRIEQVRLKIVEE